MDERQYNSANIPIGTFCRTKFGAYKEYHSSLDNFNLVTSKGLKGSYKLMIKTIKNFPKDYNIYKYLDHKGPKKKLFIYYSL